MPHRRQARLEFPLGDPEIEEQLVTLFGGVTTTISKHRTVYELNGVLIHLDKVEGLGDYVELRYRDSNEAGAAKAAELLGLTEPIKENYVTMIRK